MILKNTLVNRLSGQAFVSGVNIKTFIENVRINGYLKGCSGHILDLDTGNCVYINTVGSEYGDLKGKVMYRLAENIHDYSSNSLKNGHNRWCTEETLDYYAISLLQNEKGIKR